jgi:hypothetical protein
VERLRINLRGEREDYGFSFSVVLRKSGFWSCKSPQDKIAHSIALA